MTDATELMERLRSAGGDPLDLPFWEGCREGVFRLHRCERCGRYYWPASMCVEHGAQSMRWLSTSGRGVLYTYTVMHHAYTAAMKSKLPYVVGVVQLQEGPFFHSNVVECQLADLRVGMPLQVVMQAHQSGLVLPMFKPRAPS